MGRTYCYCIANTINEHGAKQILWTQSLEHGTFCVDDERIVITTFMVTELETKHNSI